MKETNLLIFAILIVICIGSLVEARSCVAGKGWNGSQCVNDRSVGWNQACMSNDNCATDLICKVVPNRRVHKRSYTCQCKDGTVWDQNKAACIKWDSAMKGQACLNDTSCYDTMVCSNNVCDCDTNNYVWTNYSCALLNSQTLYQYCLGDSACKTSVGLTCSSNYVCECASGYSWNFEECVQDYTGTYAAICQVDKNCDRVAGLTCNYVYNLCLCDDSQTYDATYGGCIDI